MHLRRKGIPRSTYSQSDVFLLIIISESRTGCRKRFDGSRLAARFEPGISIVAASASPSSSCSASSFRDPFIAIRLFFTLNDIQGDSRFETVLFLIALYTMRAFADVAYWIECSSAGVPLYCCLQPGPPPLHPVHETIRSLAVTVIKEETLNSERGNRDRSGTSFYKTITSAQKMANASAKRIGEPLSPR